jgi:cellulose biosynthesis protein BcsQ
MRVISILSTQGGVGKTTIAANFTRTTALLWNARKLERTACLIVCPIR